ncbi:MAG: amidohydrolase family protein [Suipraeoptans sp.]
MFIDMHVHSTFYESINTDVKVEKMRHEAMDIHLNGTASLDHIFNQMKCAGLDKLCLLPAFVSNDKMDKLVKLAPDKFIGFAQVEPFDEDANVKLEYAFAQLKLKGLKLHPSRQMFYPADKRMDEIYDVCEKYNKPIVFHSGLSWEPNTITKYARPIEFEELAMKRPKLRICLAHFGWPWIQETAMLMLKFQNVYADTALLYFDSAREFYEQVFTKDIPMTWIDRSLRHQVMFGSNNPRFEQIRMAKAIECIGFRNETVELIKGKNAIEFLGEG